MDRKGLEQLIFDTYSVEPDYPWMDTPESAVFRHAANRKWFALVTTVSKSKLGLPGQQPVDIVNLKCDPILIGSLQAEPGFYPAYHMNKENWITAALDGSARCSVRVFERYSVVGGNRLSLTLTLFQNGDTPIRLSAIAAGGSQAVFFKMNTLGEDAFLEDVKQLLEEILEG